MNMKPYILSRGLLSVVFGVVIYLISRSWWLGALSAVLIFSLFLYLPRSGRYRVKPERGVTALQRDEWTERVNDKAGRNAWVVVALLGSLAILYYGLISPGDIPVNILALVIFAGIAAYYLTDLWLRRH
jgi:hypothetical protein